MQLRYGEAKTFFDFQDISTFLFFFLISSCYILELYKVYVTKCVFCIWLYVTECYIQNIL